MAPSPRDERTFPKKQAAIDDVFSFLDSFMEQHGIEEDDAFAVRLSVDELFANMVKHNTTGDGVVRTILEYRDATFEVELIDYGVEEFNPSAPADDEGMLAAADREETRGRGIYLVRKMVDDLAYEYRDGNSHVRILKKLGTYDA